MAFNLLKFLPGGFKAADKMKKMKKAKKSKKKDSDKDSDSDAGSSGKGPGVGKLTAAGFLGSKLAGGGDNQGETMIETGSPVGSLGGLTPSGMMGGLGIGAGMFGGGGVVQTAPETVSISPGKSPLEQILGVLIQIKQDTSSLLSTAIADQEGKARAMDSMEAAAAEAKTEQSRGAGLSGIGQAMTTVTTGVKEAVGLVGKGLAAAFGLTTLGKLIKKRVGGEEGIEGVEGAVGGTGEIKEQGFFKTLADEMGLTTAVNNMFTGLKGAIFAGTPGHEDTEVGTSAQLFVKGVSQFFDSLLNPFPFLMEKFPKLFGKGGKFDVSMVSFENATNYLFGAPGEESQFAKDLAVEGRKVVDAFKRLKDAFKLDENSPIVQDFNRAKEAVTEFGSNIGEKVIEFKDDVEEKIMSVFDRIGETFQKIKDFFSLENLKKFLPEFVAKRISTKEESDLPEDPISKTQPTKEVIKEEIKKAILTDEAGFDKNKLQKGSAKIGLVPDLEDLPEAQQATILKRAENTQRQKLKAEGIEVEPKQRSTLEKDPFKNNLGNGMRYFSADPKPMAMMASSTRGGDTTNNNNYTTSNQQTVNMSGGGSRNGGVGTSNKDTSLYSGITPPSHTSSYF